MNRLTRDGTAEPVSRDQIFRHARGQGNVYFPYPADHEQDWQPYSVDPYSAICDDHTYYSSSEQVVAINSLPLRLHRFGWLRMAFLPGAPPFPSSNLVPFGRYVCVCMVTTYSRVWINRVRLPILFVVS